MNARIAQKILRSSGQYTIQQKQRAWRIARRRNTFRYKRYAWSPHGEFPQGVVLRVLNRSPAEMRKELEIYLATLHAHGYKVTEIENNQYRSMFILFDPYTSQSYEFTVDTMLAKHHHLGSDHLLLEGFRVAFRALQQFRKSNGFRLGMDIKGVYTPLSREMQYQTTI